MIKTLSFGRTGHESTRVIFGAAGLSNATGDIADSVYSLIESYGINHIDTARSYGDAELLIAPWLKNQRSKFFLASKTLARDSYGARRDLEQSLTRLGTDHLDLLQLHDLVEDGDWQTAHGKGGAVEALLKAREEGLISYIGVTGHGLRIPKMHLKSLERFDFDTVLFPYNPVLLTIDTYRRDAEALIEKCLEKNVAIQTIKSIAWRRYENQDYDQADENQKRVSWYEPLSDESAIKHAVDFILNQPGLFLVAPSDWRQLPKVLAAAASSPAPLDQDLINSDIQRLGIKPLFDGKELEKI
ncbi:MAG: aldo/keto reductase [Firmicutes bacterium]|nr:aldo/keto reductase [Bacillota bacterium]